MRAKFKLRQYVTLVNDDYVHQCRVDYVFPLWRTWFKRKYRVFILSLRQTADVFEKEAH